MKRKPWSIIILSWIHIIAPLGNLLLNALLKDRSIGEQLHYWINIYPLHLTTVYLLLPIIAGISIYICRKWSYWLYLICLALILISNIYSLFTNPNWIYLTMFLLILMIDAILVGYFALPAVHRVYFNERIRWWESAPRYYTSLPVTITETPAVIQNISAGGLLLSGDLPLQIGDPLKLDIQSTDLNISVEGVVVYKNKSDFGVKFNTLSRAQSQIVRTYLETLKKDGKIIQDRLPDTNDDFMPWLRKLLTTGKGIIPDFK